MHAATRRANPAAAIVTVATGTVWLASAGNFVAFKVAVDAVPPLLTAGGRLLLGGVLLLPLVLVIDRLGSGRATDDADNGGDHIGWRQWRAVGLAALLVLVIGQGAIVWGIQRLPAGTTALLHATAPAMAGTMAWLLFSDRPGRRQRVGIAVGLAGTALLAVTGTGAGDLDPMAVIAVLLGTAAFSLGVLLEPRLRLPRRQFVGTTLQLLVGGGALLLSAALAGEDISSVRLDTSSALALGYLVVVGTSVGFGLMLWLARSVSPILAQSYTYASPAIAVLLAWIVLSEQPTWITLVAGAASLFGATLMTPAHTNLEE